MKKTMKKRLLCTLTAVTLSIGLMTGCGSRNADEKEAKEAADGILSAFSVQDADALDRYLPETGIGSLVYNDVEGFRMYTQKMSWEITGCEREEDIFTVSMRVKNVDMVKILEVTPQKEGAQMPDVTPEQIEETDTKTFDYRMLLRKTENGYCLYSDEANPEASADAIFSLMNVITGGGFEYLASPDGAPQ